jgi:hypothetical protein
MHNLFSCIFIRAPILVLSALGIAPNVPAKPEVALLIIAELLPVERVFED